MKIKYFVFIAFLVFLQTACDNDDQKKIELPGRTVLIYMGADNNLWKFSYSNLINIIIGAKSSNLNNGHLLVYIDPQEPFNSNDYEDKYKEILSLPEYTNKRPKLIEIKKGKNGKVEQQIVKVYDEHNSASPEVMKTVFNEVFSSGNYEAESYGLLLWSHGTGWLPSDIDNYLRWFGDDHGSHMDLETLRSAISSCPLDFLIFDACYMASVEVAYAFRNNTEYILASPTEVLGDGLPYHQIIKHLFSSSLVPVLLQEIAKSFYTFYNEQPEGGALPRSASVALIKTEALPQLTTITKQILQEKEEEINNIPVANLQQLENLRSNTHALYDFEDFVKQIASDSEYAEFKQRLADVVLYKETTDIAYYGHPNPSGTILTIDKNRFCGLSSYVPQSSLVKLNNWYKQQEWYQVIYNR